LGHQACLSRRRTRHGYEGRPSNRATGAAFSSARRRRQADIDAKLERLVEVPPQWLGITRDGAGEYLLASSAARGSSGSSKSLDIGRA
jgi:hypothetical protein